MLLVQRCLALLALCSSHAVAASDDSDQTITVWNWPLSSAAPQELASIHYNSQTLKHSIKKYTPPSLQKVTDEIIRVGLYDPKAEPSWRGVAISTDTFSPQLQQLLTLHIDTSGKVHHVSLAAQDPSSSEAASSSQQKLRVELVSPVPGPVPPLNKPVVVSPSGKVEGKEEEKTFIQKYWWLFALFLLFQMLMAGGQEEKK